MTLAVVLAGGFGTRMRPLTDLRPKPALPVAGVPLLGRQLRGLADAGITDTVVATGYRADVLRGLVGDGSDHGVRVRYVHEDAPLGTGGALALALRDVPADQAVVVANGDQLTRHDLRAQLDRFAETGADLCIHARHETDARPFGLLDLDGDRITAFREKPATPVAGVVNSGTYVLHAGLLHDVPENTTVSLEREVFPQLIARGGTVIAHLEDAYSLDVGTPRALLRATQDVLATAGETARIDAADVAPDAVVDGGSWVGTGAQVAAGARIHRSIVMPGATIGEHAVLTDSIVAHDGFVAPRVHLHGCVLGEHSRALTDLPDGATLPAGSDRPS